MFGEAMSIFARERARAVGKLAGLHALEQIEVFRDAAVAERAFLGVAAVFVGFVRRQVADVGLALFDERDGVFVDLVEIVGGVERLEVAQRPCCFLGCLQAGCLRYICRRDACATRNWRQIKIRFAVAGDGFGRFAFGLEAEAVVGPAADEPVHVLVMESTYSTSSLVGLVSSMRRLQTPPNSRAMPKFRQMLLAWPMCR